jgi:hypothetical protein
MTNQELQAQYKRCQLMNDATEWDYLDIRGCSFSESMTARAQPLAGVEVGG